jgi:hypothetical protein
MLGFFGGRQRMGRVEQGFRRNAAPIQADTAELFVLLDENDFFAEVGGVKGRGVPAGAGADYHDIRFGWFHIIISSWSSFSSSSSKASGPNVSQVPHQSRHGIPANLPANVRLHQNDPPACEDEDEDD